MMMMMMDYGQGVIGTTIRGIDGIIETQSGIASMKSGVAGFTSEDYILVDIHDHLCTLTDRQVLFLFLKILEMSTAISRTLEFRLDGTKINGVNNT